MSEPQAGPEIRDIRRAPFAWQSKIAKRSIRQHFTGKRLLAAIAIYDTLTELASNAQSEVFTAKRKTIALWCGVNLRTVDSYLHEFEKIGILAKRARNIEGTPLSNEWLLVEPNEVSMVDSNKDAGVVHLNNTRGCILNARGSENPPIETALAEKSISSEQSFSLEDPVGKPTGRKQVSPNDLNPQVKQVFAGLKERRGYNSPRAAAEAKAIRAMLRGGHDPPTILACHDFMAGWFKYQDKELYMMEVQGQIDKFAKRRRDVGVPKSKGDSGDEYKGWTVIESGSSN